jgi:BCCT family betaine/carnitine transporter
LGSSEKAAPKPSDQNFEVGQDNIQVLGLDIHNPVFMISAALAVSFVVGTLIFIDSAGPAFSQLRVWITSRFDWLFMIASNFFVLFCLFIAFSRLGRVRFGGLDAKPRYGYPGWLAMLFAAGVGIGLMFFGVLEPVTHTLNPPLGIDPADHATARAAGMSAAILHWGLHAWAVYAGIFLLQPRLAAYAAVSFLPAIWQGSLGAVRPRCRYHRRAGHVVWSGNIAGPRR